MGSASGTWEAIMHWQRTLVASVVVLALVACDGDSGAVDDGPDPQVLWDVYTSYFEAITTADWDTAKSLASGLAFEYVELSEELHNISDQTGWVLQTDQSDTGPGEVVVLEDGTVAVGGSVRYRQPGRYLGLLDPHDPVFDVTGSEPLLTSWGASISADWEDYFALDERLLTLGEAGGGCGFKPLHAYDPLPRNPGAVILITIEVCPDADWQIDTNAVPPGGNRAAVTVNEGVDHPFDLRLFSRRGQTDDLIELTDEAVRNRPGPPIPGGEPTVILVVMRGIDWGALFSPMTISISLPSGPETFTVPPFLITDNAIDLVDSELLGDSYVGRRQLHDP